jgi:dienelactone hydrolase
LLRRDDLPDPKPGLVYYHGVVRNKEAYVDTHPLARRLADEGFAVAIPDAPGRPFADEAVAWLKRHLA